MNGDPAQKGREPLMERIIGWIRTRSVWLWPAIGIVFALLFTLFVIQPFGTGGALNDDDVAAAWTTSISRLGILPVYPPSEDIHVGDLWGVVADAEDTLLLNKAVRLAQINLRDEVVGDARGPMFADTAELVQGQTFRHQDTNEVAPIGNQITLSLAAFPGIVIKHNTKTSGAAGLGFGLFLGQRDNDETEEIRIPTAETYGAPVVASLGKLTEFCADQKTSLYCTDEFARRALAYATGARVLATLNGEYRARLQLSLITRTYATREIQQNRVRRDNRGGQVAVSTAPGPTGAVAAPPAATQTAAADAQPPSGSSLPANPQGSAAVNLVRGNEAQIELRQVFKRPLVFGYRAITISLTPSKPLQGAPS
jgi:hypothetical protein